MLSSLTSSVGSVCQYGASHLPSGVQMARNAAVAAIPALAIYTISNIPVAEGGPITWAACIVACEAVAASATVATGGAAAASLIACVEACWPLLALPFPP